MVNPAIAGKVMGVLGPIDGDKLGPTLIHEHMAYGNLSWFADESVAPYDREAVEAKCLKVLKDVKALGIKTVVDATPNDVGGRDPILLKSLAEKSALNMIMSTGLFYEQAGGAHYWQLLQRNGRNIEADMYELFKREITAGVGKTNIKAGVVKLASDDPDISDYEKIVFKAGVRAAKEFGLPIITHTQGDTVGPKQQELFLSLGADPKRILIGHQSNSIDINYHLSQLAKPGGFFIGFDRSGGKGPLKAEDCLIELVKKGYANRILLSHDYISVWLGRSFTLSPAFANWYPTYVHKKLIPKMKAAGVTDEQINTMLVENPRRLLTGE